MTQNPNHELGVYSSMFSAKTDVQVQDGGVVTSLLLKGLCEGLFDAAIVTRRIQGYRAEAVVAQTPKKVLAAAGTMYLKVNVSAKLRELIAQGKRRIAVVCTPCEAAVARKIQQRMGESCEVTVIGLFCFEAFNHDKLKTQLQTQLGINLDYVGKTQVKNGKFIAETGEGQVSCKVKDLHTASEASCSFCADFTSEQADISIGSVGSGEGYSTVIVRTLKGEKLVTVLNAQKTDVNTPEIAKLANFKRSRAQKNLSESGRQQKT